MHFLSGSDIISHNGGVLSDTYPAEPYESARPEKEFFKKDDKKMDKTIRILACRELEPTFLRIGNPDTEVFYFSGGSMIDMIFCTQPDAVIMNMFMEHTDAIEVVNAYRMLYGDRLTYFAVLLPSVTPMLRRELDQSGVDRVIRIPFTDKEIAGMIREVFLRKPNSEGVKVDYGIHAVHKLHSRNTYDVSGGGCALEQTLDGLLSDFGMAFCDGSRFLKRAVMLVINTQDQPLSLVSVIYPTIAREYGTTVSCVERRIRGAIADAWKNNNGLISAYFGNTVDYVRGKPSNGEFIAMLADRLRMEEAMRENRKEQAR